MAQQRMTGPEGQLILHGLDRMPVDGYFITVLIEDEDGEDLPIVEMDTRQFMAKDHVGRYAMIKELKKWGVPLEDRNKCAYECRDKDNNIVLYGFEGSGFGRDPGWFIEVWNEEWDMCLFMIDTPDSDQTKTAIAMERYNVPSRHLWQIKGDLPIGDNPGEVIA
jgi:hypothetical protein